MPHRFPFAAYAAHFRNADARDRFARITLALATRAIRPEEVFGMEQQLRTA